jgi:hypothetical protein
MVSMGISVAVNFAAAADFSSVIDHRFEDRFSDEKANGS